MTANGTTKCLDAVLWFGVVAAVPPGPEPKSEGVLVGVEDAGLRRGTPADRMKGTVDGSV
ncbi:hypothetical protein [Streptomyces sp. NPDC054794]